MTFQEFEQIVHKRYPNVKCKNTSDRKDHAVYVTEDWSIDYHIATNLWWYSEAKSRSGSGKTLEEAINNLPLLADEY